MKKLLFSVLGFCFAFGLNAQTLEEFLEPEKKQEEYLILQIGALKLQSTLIKRSTELVGAGLATWNSIQGIEAGLHENFFDSFETLGKLSQRHDLDGELTDLVSMLNKSRSSWKAKSSESSFLNWSDQLHNYLINKVKNTQSQLRLVSSEKHIKASDYERADMLERIRKDLTSVQLDFARIQQLHSSYLEQVVIRQATIRSSRIN